MCSSFAIVSKRYLLCLWWREWEGVLHVLGLTGVFFNFFGEMHWVGGDNGHVQCSGA